MQRAFQHPINFVITGKLSTICLGYTLLDFPNLPLCQCIELASFFSGERYPFTRPRI
jgi:hypothetical protein